MPIRMIFFALVLILFGVSPSRAVPFTIVFSGSATGFYGNPDYNPDGPSFILFGGSATETYYFDTDRLIPDPTYGMIDPYGEGQLVIQGVGFLGGHAFGNTLDMSIIGGVPIINSISSGIDNGYQRMYVLGAQGGFQFGTCPSIRPSCGTFFASSFTIMGYPGIDAAPVPGPIIGAGLPGLLMAFGGLIAWHRSRRAHTIAAS